VSQSLVYTESKYGEDLEKIDEELGDRKVAGVTSSKFDDVKLRWSTGLKEDETMEAVDEAVGLEQEALGARLENDALVNYHEGVVQYSSPDGDISLLPEILQASTEEEVYSESIVEGLSEEYRWLER
jgi:hypothetical protein